MKFNKWTLGLAAVGAVSLSSAVTARAVEANMNAVETMLQGVTISGGVDASLEWAASPTGNDYWGSPASGIPLRGPEKQDGFNLNLVELTIEKPLSEDQWASGFTVQMVMGPDAVNYNPSVNSAHDVAVPDGEGYDVETQGSWADFGLKQAYIALRTPIGNGIDWKFGVFDTIIGYEVFESWKNVNFTRSWGWYDEPTQHTGLLGSYTVNDYVSFSAGVANTLTPFINAKNTSGDGFENRWCKTWMASLTLTAPDSWGFLAGSTLYNGVVYGFDTFSGAQDRLNYYAGAVINTPVEGLTTGLSFDYVDFGTTPSDKHYILGGYASYRLTDKLSVHGRGEYAWYEYDSYDGCWWELTGTIQYDLWANVISRVELRYEHDDEFDYYGESKCGLLLAANINYVF